MKQPLLEIVNVDKNTISQVIKEEEFIIPEKIENNIRKIYRDVLKNKDKALLYYTEKYDKVKFNLSDIVVSKQEIKDAQKQIDKNFIKIFDRLKNRIANYHKKIFQNFKSCNLIFKKDGIVVGEKITPIEKIGIYIPGGVANYPSSVFMTVIPAKVAKVKKIYITTPPQKSSRVNPYVLYCAEKLGVNQIFKIGGPWSIFAFAIGTEIIPKVDKIVGPGNIYITCAKKMVSEIVGIDNLSGPSEIAILADETAHPEFVASDLLSQAEHGLRSKVYLITNSIKLAEDVNIELQKQIEILDRKKYILSSLSSGKIFIVDEMEIGIDIVNKLSPEHLEIQCKNAKSILKKIKNAGAIFIGKYSPVVVGDYSAGPSHVIPTASSGKFSSPLSIFDFLKRSSIISYNKKMLKEIECEIKILSEIETLSAHYNSLKQRL